MHRYRKLPIVIEAFKMTYRRRMDNAEWPNWLHEAWNKDPDEEGSFYCDLTQTDFIYIHTKEGHMGVNYGDFIIRGVQGELYPCKPDIFHSVYEKVT